MDNYVQELRQRQRQAGQPASTPAIYPVLFQQDTIRREELTLIPRDIEALFTLLSGIPFATRYQIVLDTATNLSLMEWDVSHHCETTLRCRVRVAARRSRSMLYFDHRILVETSSHEIFADVLMSIKEWDGATVYFNRSPIPFPENYSSLPLQHGINYARVSSRWVNCPLDFGFFVYPELPERFYQPLPTPGCVLGPQFAPLTYFQYQPLSETYTSTYVMVDSNSDVHRNYIRAKTRFLKMLMSSFPALEGGTPQQRAVTRNILCPQQQRLFLQLGIRYSGQTSQIQMPQAPNPNQHTQRPVDRNRSDRLRNRNRRRRGGRNQRQQQNNSNNNDMN